jgi:hypothetical protein
LRRAGSSCLSRCWLYRPSDITIGGLDRETDDIAGRCDAFAIAPHVRRARASHGFLPMRVVADEPDGGQSPKPDGSRTPKGGSARAEVNRIG